MRAFGGNGQDNTGGGGCWKYHFNGIRGRKDIDSLRGREKREPGGRLPRKDRTLVLLSMGHRGFQETIPFLSGRVEGEEREVSPGFVKGVYFPLRRLR